MKKQSIHRKWAWWAHLDIFEPWKEVVFQNFINGALLMKMTEIFGW